MIVPHDNFDPPPRYTSADEKGLIGSLLFDPSCIPATERIVGPMDFGDRALRATYTAIIDKHKEAAGDGGALAVLVLHALKESPFVDSPQVLLADVAEAVATAAHAPTFAKAVREAAVKRRIADVAKGAAQAASNGQSSDEVLSDLLASIEDLQRGRDRKSKFPRMTMGELRQNHPERRREVVEGLIREGETMNIIAAPKVGKSWLVYSLLLSIANNERWLGRFGVNPGRVWLLDNELHPEELRWRLDTVADAMGIPHDVVDREIVVTSLRGNMRSLKDLETEGIEPGEFKLIVGDACYRFATIDGDENSNTDQTKFYNLVDSIAAKTDAAFALVHHASKGDQSGKTITDVGAGAGAQSRAADCHLVIRPHEEEGAAVVHAAVRSFAPLEPLTLRWAWPVWIADDHLDPARLAGSRSKGEQTRIDRDVEDKKLILEKLAEEPEGLSVRSVRRATGFGQSKAVRLLDQLEANFLVQRYQGEASGNVCDMYQLPLGGVVQGGGTVDEPPPQQRTTGGVVGTPLKGAYHPPPLVRGTPKRTTPPHGHAEFALYATGGA